MGLTGKYSIKKSGELNLRQSLVCNEPKCVRSSKESKLDVRWRVKN